MWSSKESNKNKGKVAVMWMNNVILEIKFCPSVLPAFGGQVFFFPVTFSYVEISNMFVG